MCGLTGYVSRHPVARERLGRATGALRTRGPDGEGIFFSLEDQVGLGHRRLAIVDTPHGQQPLHNETGTLTTVVNGELYGAQRIRADLESKGHVFRTQSDSEIVLHLYEEHGLGFVDHLRGEFALLLWDEPRRRLVAARDPFGVKPLVYSQWKGELWLASRACALFAAGIPARWDSEAFAHASATQYVPPDRTLFEGIRQLPPGCLLLHEDGETRVERYWDLPLPEPSEDPSLLEEFARKLDECVRLRLPDEHHAAFQLSGGLDSAAVLAFASRASDRPLDAFTVAFDVPALDESDMAQEIAVHCEARLHLVPVTGALLLDTLPEAVRASEGLAVNGHLSGKYLLGQAIRAAGFKVVLTGEGADEVLLGYPHFRKDLDPDAPLLQANAASAGIMLSDSEGLSLHQVERRLGHVPFFMRAKAALGLRLRSVMVDFPPGDPYADSLQGLDLRRPPVERAAWLWNRSALANYILHTLGDGCEMAHSIEGRLPFLDRELADVIARLPLSLKIRDGCEKYVLREAARPLLPPSVIARKKHPFMAPSLGPALVDRLRDEAVSDHPFICRQALLRRLDTLDGLPEQERREWEPALTWLLTSYYLQRGFNLPASASAETHYG